MAKIVVVDAESRKTITNAITLEDGLLRIRGKIFILKKLKYIIFRDSHDTLVGGYRGVVITYERISERFYFLRIRKYVEKIIARYDIYKKTKYRRYKPYGLI